jgi:CRP/FNR family transcriptional regulator
MEILCRSEPGDGTSEPAPEIIREVVERPAPIVATLQHIETGSMLFQAGEPRALYRVERGAICHYVLWADGRHEVVEFAFPGDIVGLGQMSVHVSTGQAMVDTVVSLVSEEAFEEAFAHDDRLSFRLASAVEREFDYMREQALKTASRGPTARVANFLLAMSSLNAPEGRDPALITDDITAGFVADQLDMSIDKLGTALVSLKKKGAVKETPAGLRIVDLPALQRLADAA